MLTITLQAVNARRVLRTPRPATAAVRPATSLVTASLLASPVVVVVAAARTATRFVHGLLPKQTDFAKYFQCGEVGHIARNCPQNGGGYGGGYGGGGRGGYGGGYGAGGGQKTCYSCGGIGHMSRESLFCLAEYTASRSVADVYPNR